MSVTVNSRYTDTLGHLPGWANALLVVLIGLALASVSVKLLPGDFEVDTTSDSAGTAPSAAPDPTSLGQRIAAIHLFGNPEARNEAPVERVQAPVETRLNLKLAGVLAYEPQEKAIAIISAGSAEQKAFGIGDKVSGETRLKRVYPDHVVLDNRGREEILRLPVDSQPIAMAPAAAPSTAQMPTSAQSSAGLQGASGPVELPTTPGALRDTLARNPSLLGRVVAAEPYQENGKLMGYRITPKQNPEILESQGIVAGDVITSVNNIQLNSQKQGIRALRNAVKADNLEVTVLRDGVEVPLSISLAQ